MICTRFFKKVDYIGEGKSGTLKERSIGQRAFIFQNKKLTNVSNLFCPLTCIAYKLNEVRKKNKVVTGVRRKYK